MVTSDKLKILFFSFFFFQQSVFYGYLQIDYGFHHK